MNDILTLSEENGQGEAMSKLGAKGLFAAKEWIDNSGNNKPEEPFPLHVYDRWYPELVNRSFKGRRD
jgi:hypothetical protein